MKWVGVKWMLSLAFIGWGCCTNVSFLVLEQDNGVQKKYKESEFFLPAPP